MAKTNGGRAFPRAGVPGNQGMWESSPEDGMTLRQWYAGKVIPTIIARTDTQVHDIDGAIQRAAKLAFRIADAMIEEDRATKA